MSDGDLIRLARDDDPVAFRLLVERHQPMVRARARSLSGNPSDVDDVVQESFLQAFIALDRLRDPDRFAGWLAGIVLNVCRSLRRRDRVTLLADWPEPLHPASADGLPSAEDLDRADAVRAAVVALPAGQRRSVALHYYAGLPAGQVALAPGAARASLHKARLRLRAYITEHRPDLIPVTRRTHMTTVRIARVESHIPPGPTPISLPSHVIVLADDAGHRDLPLWLLGDDGLRLSGLFESSARDAEGAPDGPASTAGGPASASAEAPRTPDELTSRLLRAAGARVTGVDIDELGPEMTVARIALDGPGAGQTVTARLTDGLAVALTTGAPVRVADSLLDRLSVPIGPEGTPAEAGQALEVPERTARDLGVPIRPRYEPRNLDFAGGLDRWFLGGSFLDHASQAHWQDYASSAGDGTAALSATGPSPEGFAFLGQEIFAEDYRDATAVFRAQVRVQGGPRAAGVFLTVRRSTWDIRGALTEAAVRADPGNHIVTVTGGGDWARAEVTAPIPDDACTIVFGVFLAGPGRVEFRHPDLARAT